ncbi:MAG: NifU family protein [Parvularculales bacterium]
MFVQTESTPNPATLKFLPGCEVLGSGAADFPDPEAARRSPLAERLFAIDGVTGVFFGADFITVTKAPESGDDWQQLKPAVLMAIVDHFSAGQPLLLDDEARSAHAEHGGADSETATAIQEILDTRIRPAVAQDGGDVLFHGFEEGVVYLHMQGACAGCPSATETLKHGIENLLRHFVPEVTEVRAV